MPYNQLLELNSNENSLGMSPVALQAVIDALDNSFRYPDDQRAELVATIARIKGVKQSQVSLSNGSSETIRAVVQMLLFKALKLDRPFQVVVPHPTFNYAETYALAADVPVIKVPLTVPSYDLDLSAMQKIADDFDGVTLFYLCNPNNPTATITDTEALKSWVINAPDSQYFLLDEAYAEYVTDKRFESGIEWVKQHISDNVIVARTFSKLCALAGMRVGYAIAAEKTIADIEKFMSIDNTNLSGAVAVLATLNDSDFLKNSLESTTQSRHLIESALNELGLRYLPSQANFIFHEIKGDVATYIQRMKDAGVIVGREFAPITGFNRLTLGTPDEMRAFINVLKDFRQKGWV